MSVWRSRQSPQCATDEGSTRNRVDRPALAAGHEGIMAKSLTAPYQAGNRGADWLKIKPTHTLDLVILAAEWGSGRRAGKLSNLHLGAVDPVNGGFVMLGKTFKGLTDKMLAWQTDQLLARELGRQEGRRIGLGPQLQLHQHNGRRPNTADRPAGLLDLSIENAEEPRANA